MTFDTHGNQQRRHEWRTASPNRLRQHTSTVSATPGQFCRLLCNRITELRLGSTIS